MIGCQIMTSTNRLFWAIFCPFTPSGAQESKFKKTRDIIILHQHNRTCDHMFVWRVMDQTDRLFWANFYLLKINLEILWLYTSIPTIMIIWCTVSDYWFGMDGKTKGQTEKVTYGGESPTWKQARKGEGFGEFGALYGKKIEF